MAIYQVRFMKTVADDTGHERQVCQGAVEIEAENAEAALMPAQAAFCDLEKITSWTHRADCCEAVCKGAALHTNPAKWPTAR